MRVWPSARPPASVLTGSEGELLQVRISADARLLEELLDCLAGLSFPINPQIYHTVPTVVEFPVYQARLGELNSALRACGFDAGTIQVSGMMEAIASN